MSIEYKKEGHIAIFTINRPEVMNAVSPEIMAEWTENLIEFREDKNMWVGIVTGVGKAFCTGLDLSGEPPSDMNPNTDPSKLPKTLCRGLEMWKPLVAAINGYALGGGLEIAMACDIRIASEKAKMGLPEVTLGLIPGWGGTQRLPRLISLSAAMEMIIMGKRIDAQEALKLGLVHEVVAPEELMNAAMARAEKICEGSPIAIQGVKQAILRGLNMPLEEALLLEPKIGSIVTASKDYQEGMSAFLEKRKPNYTGE
jgi:E-phenylitaconyl-CoA hydratase